MTDCEIFICINYEVVSSIEYKKQYRKNTRNSTFVVIICFTPIDMTPSPLRPSQKHKLPNCP